MSFNKGIQHGWNSMSSSYQNLSDISIDDIHFAPFAAGNNELNLLGELEGKSILELGSGALQNSVFMSHKGADVTAVDFSINQLNYGQKFLEAHKSNINVVLADISQLDFLKPSQFDGIITIFALEFLENIDLFFKSCERLLKPKGWLVVSTVHPLGAFEWDDRKELLEVGNYFNPPVEVWREADSDPNAVTIFRPISEIFTSITDSGLEIEILMEPAGNNSRSPYKGSYWEPYRDRFKFIPFAVVFKALKR